MNLEPYEPRSIADVAPEGCTLLAFFATVQILRNGKRVAEVPKPNDPLSLEEWRTFLADAVRDQEKAPQ